MRTLGLRSLIGAMALGAASVVPIVVTGTTAGAADPGIWRQPGFAAGHRANNPHESTITSANVDDLEQLWAVDVGAAANGPVVANGRVFVAASNTGRALNAATGAELWKQVHQEQEHLLYVGTPVIRSDGRVLAPISWTGGGGSVGYDFATGAADVNAQFHGGSTDYTVRRTRIVSVGFAYGSGGPFIVTLNYGGQHPGLLSCCGLPTPTVSEPTIFGDTVYVVVANQLLAFRDGECAPLPVSAPFCGPSWHVNLDSAGSTPVAFGSNRIAVATESSLTVYDAADGAQVWKAMIPSGSPVPPAVALGRIYVAGLNGTVYTLKASGCDAATCTPRPRFTGAYSPSVQPIVAGDVLYVGTGDGAVLAYPARGCGRPQCAPAWSDDLPEVITAGPVVVDGTLFAGDQSGVVRAYRIPS